MATFVDGSKLQIWVLTEVSCRLGYQGASKKTCDYMVRQFKQTPQLYERSIAAHSPVIGGEVRLTRADGSYDVVDSWGKGALPSFVPVIEARAVISQEE